MDRKRNVKIKKGLTVLEAMVTGGILSIVALITAGTIFNTVQNNAAAVTYDGVMKKIRTAIYICGTEKASVISGGSEGVAICGGEEKFPLLPDRCSQRAPSYRITGDDGSWNLTTVLAINTDELWYCRGCNIACTADGCVYNEAERGACKRN